MNIEKQILDTLRTLPLEKQKEVLDFVDSLNEKKTVKEPRRNLLGLWADLNVDITNDDIAEAPREMWSHSSQGVGTQSTDLWRKCA